MRHSGSGKHNIKSGRIPDGPISFSLRTPFVISFLKVHLLHGPGGDAGRVHDNPRNSSKPVWKTCAHGSKSRERLRIAWPTLLAMKTIGRVLSDEIVGGPGLADWEAVDRLCQAVCSTMALRPIPNTGDPEILISAASFDR